MNYFYLEEEKIIVGVTVYTDVDNVCSVVPLGKEFWIYNSGDDIDDISKTRKPDGIGTSRIAIY